MNLVRLFIMIVIYVFHFIVPIFVCNEIVGVSLLGIRISILTVEKGLQVIGTCDSWVTKGVSFCWFFAEGRVTKMGIDGATGWLKVLVVKVIGSCTF